MPFSIPQTHHVTTECKRIREGWSSAELAQRRKLGEVRTQMILRWLKSAEGRAPR